MLFNDKHVQVTFSAENTIHLSIGVANTAKKF